MSLVVSLRIPDGVVIAADSLSTLQGQVALRPEFKTHCPKCRAAIDVKMSPVPMPPTSLSTSSSAQKLFPFHGKFGVAAFGLSVIMQRTVGYHVETLEQSSGCDDYKGVTEVAQAVFDRFDKLIAQQIKDIKDAPDDYYPLGFQVVGYDKDEGKTIELRIGKKSKTMPIIGLGCTVSGAAAVVQKLWELGDANPGEKARFDSFSLQDAIDYADFLINTTAGYQRFASMIPNVGGQVDIALATPYHGFRWIRQKKLARIVLGKGDGEHD